MNLLSTARPTVTLRVVDSRHACGWTSNGIDWDPVGCSHERPDAALAHSRELEEQRPRSLPGEELDDYMEGTPWT